MQLLQDCLCSIIHVLYHKMSLNNIIIRLQSHCKCILLDGKQYSKSIEIEDSRSMVIKNTEMNTLTEEKNGLHKICAVFQLIYLISAMYFLQIPKVYGMYALPWQQITVRKYFLNIRENSTLFNTQQLHQIRKQNINVASTFITEYYQNIHYRLIHFLACFHKERRANDDTW